MNHPFNREWKNNVDNLFGRTIQTLDQNKNWQGDKGQYILNPELVTLNLEFLREVTKNFIRSLLHSEKEAAMKQQLEWDEQGKKIEIASLRDELCKKIEGSRLNKKGKIYITFSNGQKAEMDADTDRALIFNAALDQVLDIVRGK